MEQAPVTTNSRLERGDGPLGGVAAGMAEYFDIDPTIIRLGLVATTVLGGPTIPIVYLAAWLIVPAAEKQPSVGNATAPVAPAPSAAPAWPEPVPTPVTPAAAPTQVDTAMAPVDTIDDPATATETATATATATETATETATATETETATATDTDMDASDQEAGR